MTKLSIPFGWTGTTLSTKSHVCYKMEQKDVPDVLWEVICDIEDSN